MKRLQAINLVLATAGLTLLSTVGFAADPSTTGQHASSAAASETVVVSAERFSSCSELSPEAARLLADSAFEDEAYERAGACYLAAGDRALADRAFLKAVAPRSAVTAQKLAANRQAVMDQARQLQAAFRHR